MEREYILDYKIADRIKYKTFPVITAKGNLKAIYNDTDIIFKDAGILK